MIAVPAGGPTVSPSRSSRLLLARLAALTVLIGAVAVVAGLAGYTRGRTSVDQNAVSTRAFAEGRLAGVQMSQQDARNAAVKAGVAARHNVDARTARAWQAGRQAGIQETAFRQRAHGRELGAAAALGSFPGGWRVGGWYVVHVGSGSSLTGGAPALNERFGPLHAGERYGACGTGICRTR